MALSGKTTQLIQRKYSSFVKVACDRSIRLHYECRTLRQPTHSHEAQSVSVVRDFHWDSRVFSVTTEMLQINYYKVWISCVAWYRTADRGISWKISTDSLFLFPRFFALCHQNSKETFVASRKKTRKSEMEKVVFSAFSHSVYETSKRGCSVRPDCACRFSFIDSDSWMLASRALYSICLALSFALS